MGALFVDMTLKVWNRYLIRNVRRRRHGADRRWSRLQSIKEPRGIHRYSHMTARLMSNAAALMDRLPVERRDCPPLLLWQWLPRR